jgi:DNA-binding NarL/FixJ family response regulator
MEPDPTCIAIQHGTYNAYRRHRCRCPDAVTAARARWRARPPRRRPPPPEPYIDPIAVERACAGDPVRLTTDERRTAIAHMHQRGVQVRTIARRLQISERTVHRHLAAGIRTQAA